jgi:glycosyltransferase involved in cell wall biosynthesis
MEGNHGCEYQHVGGVVKSPQTIGPPTVSVILPVYNENENLEALISRRIPVLEAVGGGAFEVLFIDDASHDGSAEILDSFQTRDCRLKTIHFSRNSGHQAACKRDSTKPLDAPLL